jgi:hypothetical protein
MVNSPYILSVLEPRLLLILALEISISGRTTHEAIIQLHPATPKQPANFDRAEKNPFSSLK